MTWILIMFFYVPAGYGTTAAATTAVFQTEAACYAAGNEMAAKASGARFVCARSSK